MGDTRSALTIQIGGEGQIAMMTKKTVGDVIKRVI
jgi:hypothetical protein